MYKYLCILGVGLHVGCAREKTKASSQAGENAMVPNEQGYESQYTNDLYRPFSSSGVNTWETIGDLSNDPLIIRQDLKPIFCEDAYYLDLVDDFSETLGVICTDKKPNDVFDKLDRYSSRVTTAPLTVQLAMEHGEDGFSTGSYVVVYRYPIEPKWVRTGSIVKFLYSNTEYDYLRFTGSVTANLSKDLAGTLQFGKWQMNARMDITTPDGLRFANSRNTEMNSFQVTGGNPNIGLGAERLLDKDNPDYKNYQTATVTLATVDGGSIMFTLIRATTRNNGYKETAEKIFNDLALSQGVHVYDGIMQQYAAGHFDPKQDRTQGP